MIYASLILSCVQRSAKPTLGVEKNRVKKIREHATVQWRSNKPTTCDAKPSSKRLLDVALNNKQ